MPAPETSTIRLKVGETHSIRLKGRGTTGAGWSAVTTGEKIVSLEKKYIPGDKHVPPLAGSSSDEQFTITALKKGETELNLKLSRAWETDKKPKEEKKYLLIVE